MFYWHVKSSVRLPKSTIYGGSKWSLFTPKTAWIKIAQKRPLESTEHKNGKDSPLGLANPLTVTNLGGVKNGLYLPQRRHG